ncbi:MAG TPA: MarR family transcriptional regulator [Dehalococcoidia bacterium]|nr:MarR family transcriptional regulator [Dehalococcoidia bacterium]
MPHFTVLDGRLAEQPVRELATWYNKRCPGTPALTFETHLMILRAYVTLVTDSPLETIAGLSRARYNILRMLYQQDNRRLYMSDFAHRLQVSPTNITKLVDGLVADGLVARGGDPVDKRKRWAELTPKGVEMVEKALPAVAEHVNSLLSCLTEEEKQVLVHLLAKLRLNWLSHASPEIAKQLLEASALEKAALPLVSKLN